MSRAAYVSISQIKYSISQHTAPVIHNHKPKDMFFCVFRINPLP